MGVFKNEVTLIEDGKGAKGPYKLLHIKDLEKPKKVWGPLAANYTVPGLYEVKSDKNDEGVWETTSVKLLSKSNGNGRNEPSGHTSPDASRSPSIEAQTAVKAAASFLGQVCASMPAAEAMDMFQLNISRLTAAAYKAVDGAVNPPKAEEAESF